MRQSLITFVAVYAVVLGATSCGNNNSTPAYTPGKYIQIERLARPAVKEAFQMFADHDGTNRTAPWAQPYSSQTLYQAIGSFTTGTAGRSQAIANTLQAILIPDEMAADLSKTVPASYLGVETMGATGGTFGGRSLTDDVIDISLGATFGNTIPSVVTTVPDDGKESPCLTTDNVPSQAGPDHITPATFPYVGAPH